MKRVFKVYDPVLYALALLATCLGLFFIYDAGYARSLSGGRGPLPPEFLTQLKLLIPALIVSHIASALGAPIWAKLSKPFWVVCFLLLIAVEKFGTEMNGAKRWIGTSSLNIQPAEFVKVAVVVYIAALLANRPLWPKKFPKYKTFVKKMDMIYGPKIARVMPAIWIGIAALLIEKEPDLGTAAVVGVTAFALFWMGGVSKKSLAIGVLAAGLGVGYMIHKEPYRLKRIENHWARWDKAHVDDETFQTVQAELAISSGGVLGVGVGNGHGKHILPAPTTDFIMATVGEETGLLGSLVVLSVIGGIVWRLMWHARKATTRFAMLLFYGVGTWIGVQACVNVMMANGFMPAIGIPLPLISSGGSSMVALWMAFGICQATLAPQPVAKPASEGENGDGQEGGKRATHRNRRWNRRPRLSRA